MTAPRPTSPAPRRGLRAPRWLPVDALRPLAPLQPTLLGVLLFRAGCVLLPFYGLYLTRDLGLGTGGVALVVACFGVGGLVADLAAPATLSALSPVRAILLGLVLQAAALALAAVASGVATLVVATVIWGFCYEVVTPSCFALIARSVSGGEEKIAFAVFRLYINAGMALGPVLGSVIVAGGHPTLLFVVNGGMGLVAALVVWLSSRRRALGDDAEEERTVNAWFAGWRGEARFWGFMAAAFPAQLAFALPSTVLSLYLVDELGRSPLLVGVILFVNAAMVIGIELPLNLAMRRWRTVPTLALGLALTAVGFGVTGAVSSVWALVLAAVVWTGGEMVVGPAFPGHVREISTPEMFVRNIGIFSGGVNAGLLLAPIAYSAGRDLAVPGGVWTGVAVLLAPSVVVYGLRARRGGPHGRAG